MAAKFTKTRTGVGRSEAWYWAEFWPKRVLAVELADPLALGSSAWRVHVWSKFNRSSAADKEAWADTLVGARRMANELVRELWHEPLRGGA